MNLQDVWNDLFVQSLYTSLENEADMKLVKIKMLFKTLFFQFKQILKKKSMAICKCRKEDIFNNLLTESLSNHYGEKLVLSSQSPTSKTQNAHLNRPSVLDGTESSETYFSDEEREKLKASTLENLKDLDHVANGLCNSLKAYQPITMSINSITDTKKHPSVFGNQLCDPIPKSNRNTLNNISDFEKLPDKKIISHPGYVYRGPVVRKYRERRKLQGWECYECQNMYNALLLDSQERKKIINMCSKHRQSTALINNTPPGIWNIDIIQSPENVIQYGKLRKRNPLQKKRTIDEAVIVQQSESDLMFLNEKLHKRKKNCLKK